MLRVMCFTQTWLKWMVTHFQNANEMNNQPLLFLLSIIEKRKQTGSKQAFFPFSTWHFLEHFSSNCNIKFKPIFHLPNFSFFLANNPVFVSRAAPAFFLKATFNHWDNPFFYFFFAITIVHSTTSNSMT